MLLRKPSVKNFHLQKNDSSLKDSVIEAVDDALDPEFKSIKKFMVKKKFERLDARDMYVHVLEGLLELFE